MDKKLPTDWTLTENQKELIRYKNKTGTRKLLIIKHEKTWIIDFYNVKVNDSILTRRKTKKEAIKLAKGYMEEKKVKK